MKIDKKQLMPYLKMGLPLIPLHNFGYVDNKGRERGKSPQHNDWRRQKYSSKKVIETAVASGNNVGFRLRDVDLIVDFDPKNFEVPFDSTVERRFAADVGLDLSKYPRVQTGGGGSHYYMTKPAGVRIKNSLESWKGIEFKTRGQQVVTAGSIHPKSREHYNWDPFHPDISDGMPSAPERLIGLIQRPDAPSGGEGEGEHTPEQVAKMLDALNPENFTDYKTWLELLMSCHHASGGEARAEFIEWSTRDAAYADQAWQIGRHWDSCKPGGGITARTLYGYVTKAGHNELIPRTSAADDFPDDAEDRSAPDFAQQEPQANPLEKMNLKYCTADDGEDFVIFTEKTDPRTGNKYWAKYKRRAFEDLLANRKLQKGEGLVPLAKAWIEWPGRKHYVGVVFDPSETPEGYLNLWRGWAVEPRPGDWSLLQRLLREALCAGDEAVYRYVLDWSAYMVQKPNRAAEVALVFQGRKGTGKGTFCRFLTMLAGRHGMHITSPEHITGRFNSHLRDIICLFADEAITPYDKAGESRLKGLITEPTMLYEAKNVNAVMGKNLLHVVMASNEDWVVPMSPEERRFMVTRVTDQFMGDRAFFDALHQQMEKDGGLEAMMHDLKTRDIGDWAPRESIPRTAAATEQKVRNLSVVARWWVSVLNEGEMPGDERNEWQYGTYRAFLSDLKSHFRNWRRDNDPKGVSNGREIDQLFAQELRRFVPTLSETRRRVPADRGLDVNAQGDGAARAWKFPSLDECKAQFEKAVGKVWTAQGGL